MPPDAHPAGAPSREDPGPHLSGRRTRPTGARPTAARLGGVALVVLLAGCAQAEEATRSAVEEAARDAVAEATAGTATAGREVARQRAQGAVDEALASVPGTCADVVSLPSSIRLENAEVVLRAFWLGELSTAQPSAELVEQFADAVVARCEDSRETAAADVISEVWDTGAYAP